MVTGQSDFFSMSPGATTFITDIFPSELDPIPISIDVAAPADFIPLGATAQLTVTATLPDASTTDVTARAAGTTYLSTNPNLLTVDENGLVTGANTTTTIQTGTIAVLHEGNISTINFNAVGQSDDFDNDGMPNDWEELFGLNAFVNDPDGDLDGDGLTNLEEFQLGTLPNNPDTDMDGIIDSLDGDPLHPDEAPPSVTITVPGDVDTLLEGETVIFTVEVMDDGLVTSVGLFVNGLSFATVPDPTLQDMVFRAELPFTVPYALTGGMLEFSAIATDTFGNTGTADVTVPVIPDPLTTVVGLVVDLAANPVEEADVTLELNGLLGEFFNFVDPLTTFPDLTGLTPDITKPISSVNFLNPNNLFSLDTFGVDLAPNYAARFSGLLRIPTPETYTFVLGADDGARLIIDGTPVVEVIGTGDFTENAGSIFLPVGSLPIEIEYFQSDGDAELQLSFNQPLGRSPADSSVDEPERVAVPGPNRVISPSSFLLEPDLFTGLSDAQGGFAFPLVPANLGDLIGRAQAIFANETALGQSQPTTPQPDDVTDLGDIVLLTDAIVGYYDLTQNAGNANQIAPIETIGFEALDVGDLTTADLSLYDIMFVQNPNNGGYTTVYLNNLAAVFDFVTNGGILVFHDRHVSSAATILPGSPGNIVRSIGTDIDIVNNTTSVTDGPGGIITNTNLDGGAFSHHGYADAATIPLNGFGILSTETPTRLVTYAYPFGQGWVVYSTIPLDCYLAFCTSPATFREIYAPNVLDFANDLRVGAVAKAGSKIKVAK